MTPQLVAAVGAWCDTRRVRVMRVPAVLLDPDETWWIDGKPSTVPPADAASGWATVPPLLLQLAAAVGVSGESGKGTGRGGGGVVDWDAVDILDRLRDCAEWRPSGGVPLGRWLRQSALLPWGELEAAQQARVLWSLARRAESHLVPPEVAPWRYVRADCPQCGYRRLSAVDGDGLPVTGFALVVEFHRHFVNRLVCQVCWALWTRQQLADWALDMLALT